MEGREGEVFPSRLSAREGGGEEGGFSSNFVVAGADVGNADGYVLGGVADVLCVVCLM